LPHLTLEMGLREEFQVYPQPAENPAFPLTGQYPNQFLRLAPRFGFAWQLGSKTVVRGGLGQFFDNMNGLNYRNAVVSNGLASQQSSVSATYNPALPPNQQVPTFPSIIPGNSSLFQASPDISLVSPQFRVPYVLQASLQIEQEISENTTVSIGGVWNHALHLLSGSAYDLNLNQLQGTTTYIVCPPGTTTAPCDGADDRSAEHGQWATDRRPHQPQSGRDQRTDQPRAKLLQVLLRAGAAPHVALQFSYTLAKSTMLDGMDFNNQFDFSNTQAPSLLDQRHRISFAAVYQPGLEKLTTSNAGRAVLSGWRLSSVMEFSSGRPYAGLLSPACTSPTLSFSNCAVTGNDNLNDTAFNEDTAINYYVQNGDGINQLQYNPIGTNCGDGMTLNQTCYLVPNSGTGDFGALQEISPNGLPRVFQFSARFTF